MKVFQSKGQSLLTIFLSLILSFGIVGGSVCKYPSSINKQQSSEFSTSQYFNQNNSSQVKFPFLPGNSYFEETESFQEKDEAEDISKDHDFIGYARQIQIKIADRVFENYFNAESGHPKTSDLSLYLLFHSWKSFLS